MTTSSEEQLLICCSRVSMQRQVRYRLDDLLRGPVRREHARLEGDLELLQRLRAVLELGVVRVGTHEKGDFHADTSLGATPEVIASAISL